MSKQLPPHERDHGRPGNPERWCERCRIDAARARESEHPIGIHYDIPLGVIAAQAPQSSPAPGVKPDGIMNEGYIEATRAHGYPAPSVIEAGDAMENMMRRLRTQRDDDGILPTGNDFNGMDGLCAAWVAAKASRPSVTAAQGVMPSVADFMHGVFAPWYRDSMIPWLKSGDFSDTRGISKDLEDRLSALLTK